MTRSTRRRVATVGFAIVSAILMIYILFPYYWMLVTAVKPKEELFLSPATLYSTRIIWQNLISPWKMFPIARYFGNSLFVTASTVCFTAILGSMAGYGLSQMRRKKLSAMIIGLLLFTQLLPGSVTIVPFYFWAYRFGFINRYIGLILPYMAGALPFSTLMLRAYFGGSFPRELAEAARIDGCSKLGAYIRVAMPLSVPGLVAVGSYTFMIAWKEFLWASIMISAGSKKPLAVGLRDLIGEGGNVDYISEFMAVGLAATLPAFLIFFVFQRYIAGGLTAGSVKG